LISSSFSTLLKITLPFVFFLGKQNKIPDLFSPALIEKTEQKKKGGGKDQK
jgi:hypothetical protein